MLKNIESKFNKYLNLVCKDKDLILYSQCFFNDLCKEFNGKVFTKSDFETQVYKGKTYIQDSVKSLFKFKRERKIDEIFYYLFKNNVNVIEYFLPEPYENTSADYAYYRKTIRIAKINMEELIQSILAEKDFKTETLTEEQIYQKALGVANEVASFENKENLYHELGHVLDFKRFKHKSIIKHSFQTHFVLRNIFEDYKTCETESLNKNADKTIMSNKKVLNLAKMQVKRIQLEGESALDEISNEVFVNKLNNCFIINHFQNISLNRESLFQGVMEGNCSYNEDIDILTFLEMASKKTRVKDTLFNSHLIINELNGKNFVSKLPMYKKKIIEEISKDVIIKKNDFEFFECEKLIKNFSIFDTITFAMGVVKLFRQSCKNSCDKIKINEIQLKEEIKTKTNKNLYLTTLLKDGNGKIKELKFKNKKLAEEVELSKKIQLNFKKILKEMFLEIIKENMLKEINDSKTIKDEKYFVELNNKLENINTFIGYDFEIEYKNYYNFDTKEGNLNLVLLNDKTVENYATEKPNENLYQLFNEIVKLAENEVITHSSNAKDFIPTMTFLLKQIKLKQKLKTRETLTKMELNYLDSQSKLNNNYNNLNNQQELEMQEEINRRKKIYQQYLQVHNIKVHNKNVNQKSQEINL
ncbi:MAG: hypothetical protein RR140_01350 [Clostridia bacterium]